MTSTPDDPSDPSASTAPAGARVPPGAAPGWERSVLEKLALAGIDEKRRARRWGIFFRILFFAYLTAFLGAMLGWWGQGDHKSSKSPRHTAVVDVKGVIEAEGDASAGALLESLKAAFADSKTAGVVIRINSPGGSPVQAGIVHDEIKRLRAKHPEIPVYAVVEEVCASGGYYIAAAADKIFVDKASIVGSIGVLMDGYGFVGAMDKLGVERRLLTAGRNKGFLDSFSPMSDEHRRLAQAMLDEIHQQFIAVVKSGRGNRLKDDPDLFSGLFWSGARSVELGLADALGTVDGVARDVVKAEEIVDFSPHENLAERLAKRIGASAGQTLARALNVGGAVPALR